MFSLCSLILGPQPPSLTPWNPSKSPRPHLVCGPGGAGACCPEDRGSAGSQKHLSVPLPLHCNPPGTALSPAPAVRKCVCGCVCVCVCKRKGASWVSDYGRAGVCKMHVCATVVCVHECVSACLFPPRPQTHHSECDCELMVAAPLHPQPRHLFSPPHIMSLTWLNASSSHPD